MSKSPQKNTYVINRIEDDILHFQFIGDVSKEVAKEYAEEVYNLLEKDYTPEQPLHLISNSESEKHSSPGGRRQLVELIKDKRIGRIAIYNGPAPLRIIITFVLKATGRNNIRFFDTEADAITWVKEYKPEL